MRVIEAPNDIILNDNEITCFLAGGITDCEDWQSKVIEYLEETIILDDLVLLNPRRKTFDVTDKSASRKQIEWEFNALNNMDIFTMYFADSASVQPICMYELGRHLERMQHRFTHDWRDRIFVGIEDGYSRLTDVVIQTGLALGGGECYMTHMTPDLHAQYIAKIYSKLRYK